MNSLLVWQPPIGDYDHFDVLYDRGFGRDRLTTNSTLVNSITIRRLRPFKNYTFSVFTISGKKYFIVFASNAANVGTLFVVTFFVHSRIEQKIQQ